MRTPALLLPLLVLPLACGRLSAIDRVDDAGGEGPVTDGAALLDVSAAAVDGVAPFHDAGGPPEASPAADGAPVGDALDALARVCLLAASCGAGMSPPQAIDASACTATVAAALPDDPVAARLFGCAASRSCAELGACVGTERILLHAYSPQSQCQGSSIVAPDGSTYDCAVVGLTCVKETLGERAYCAASACGPTTSPTCNGDRVEQCVDDIPSSRRCAGGTCSAGQCVGAGPACDPVHTPDTCSGSSRVSCVGGRLAALDCATEPIRSQCASGACTHPASSHAPCLTGNSSCSGDDVVLCVDGEERRVSCPGIGFSSCTPAAGSQEVRCR
jgi:hypothetical protein